MKLSISARIFLPLIFFPDALAVKPLVELETEAAAEIETCLSSSDPADFLSKLPIQDGGIWAIPLDILGLNSDRIRNLNPPVEVQFPDGSIRTLPQGLEWFAPIIPSTFSNDNGDIIPGLPPPYDPMSPFSNMVPPFFHVQETPASWGYNKWPAFPFNFMAFFRLDPESYESGQSKNTVFLTNRADRGNLKQQYMSALTCDKLPLYEKKVDKMIQAFHQDVVVRGKPVVSTWKIAIFDLYFDLHFGETKDVPNFVRDWVDDLATNIAFQVVDESDEDRMARLELNFCRYPAVVAWMEERYNDIKDKDDDSTFVYWWDKAGVPLDSVVFEAAHNVLAFTQFINMMFLTIRAQQNIIGVNNIYTIAQNPFVGPTNFFEEYSNAGSDSEKLNVVREAYRLLLPNQLSLSALDESDAPNEDKKITDPNFIRTESLHFHMLIQAINDGFDPFTGTTQAGTYDTDRYGEFQPDSKCPFASVMENAENAFTVSGVDFETVIPPSHEKFFPVFEQPKYCPFGLGYRRCPAELFDYFILGKMLETLEGITFSFPGTLFEPVDPHDPAAIAIGTAFALDNIYASAI